MPGALPGLPPGAQKIKGGRWTVFRFFLVSVAFTSAWVAVSSQLGYYRRIHGPEVLLQVSEALSRGTAPRWRRAHFTARTPLPSLPPPVELPPCLFLSAAQHSLLPALDPTPRGVGVPGQTAGSSPGWVLGWAQQRLFGFLLDWLLGLGSVTGIPSALVHPRCAGGQQSPFGPQLVSSAPVCLQACPKPSWCGCWWGWWATAP